MTQPFVVQRHGRLMYPSNSQPDLDFLVIEAEEHFEPRIEAPGEGEYVCSNDDLARNAAPSWSPADQPGVGLAHGSDDVATAFEA